MPPTIGTHHSLVPTLRLDYAQWVVGPICGGLLAGWWGVQNSFYIAGVGVAICSFGYARLPETLHAAVSAAAASSATAATATSATAATSAAPATAAGSSSSSSSSTTHTLGCHSDAAPDAALAPSPGYDLGGDETPTYQQLLRSPNVQALSALSMSSSFSQGCFMAVLTLHARNLFGASPADIGLMFSLVGMSYVAGGPVGGWLASRVGRRALIVPGLALSNLAFGSLVLASERESFFALLLLSNLSMAVVSPAISAFTAEVLAPEVRGQAMSISRSAADVASLGAPLALGMLADATSCGTSILATAGLCASCTTIFSLRAAETKGVVHGLKAR